MSYPSSFFNQQYLNGEGIRLTSWRMAVVPQNSPPYSINTDLNIGVSSGVSKATPGSVYSVYATNANSDIRYLQFFDTSLTPIANTSPILSFLVTSGITSSPTQILLGTDFFGPNGVAFNYGVAWGISTNESTFMPTSSPSEHTVIVNYV